MHPFLKSSNLTDKQLQDKINDLRKRVHLAKLNNFSQEGINQLSSILDSYETLNIERYSLKSYKEEESKSPMVTNIGWPEDIEKEEKSKSAPPIEPDEAMQQINKMLKKAKKKLSLTAESKNEKMINNIINNDKTPASNQEKLIEKLEKLSKLNEKKGS